MLYHLKETGGYYKMQEIVVMCVGLCVGGVGLYPLLAFASLAVNPIHSSAIVGGSVKSDI